MKQKNIFQKLLAGACLLAIASCAELTPVQNQTEENVSGQGSRIEVLGLCTETDTKVTLSETTFAWQAGDKIAVWTGTDDSHGAYQECTVASNGTLPVVLQEGESRFHYALYPASIRYNGYYAANSLRIVLPDTYNYDDVCGDNVQTPMIARNDNNSPNLVFYNLASMLRLTVTLPKRTVKMKIKFTPDTKATGTFDVRKPNGVEVGTTCATFDNALSNTSDEIFITGIHDIPAVDSTITVNIPISTGDDYNDFTISAWDSEDKAIKAEVVHLASSYTATRAHGKKITTTLTQGTFGISKSRYCIISPANLMYDGTKGEGKRFVFHEHASDVSPLLAHDAYNEGAVFDTFTYGSSGFNNKNPWNRNIRAGYTDLQTTSADWGVYNEISSYKKKTWVTPLKDDWQSLISNHIQATASLDGQKGYILIPIDYSGPTIVGGMHSNVDNVYTTTPTDNWTPVKAAGAAFLPFQYYWTGTNGSDSTEAWYTTNHNQGSGQDIWHFIQIEKHSGGAYYVRLINIL